ncbi:MAG: phosphodiester glycosidase family protein [Legionella sp.]|nr:MAG: phosphodiester glycosidase family protein [Legionella sp.]
MSSQTNAYPTIKAFLLCFFVLLSVLLPFNSYSANDWQELSPGIEYQDLLGGILNPWSHVHVFRVDLQKNKLELINARSLSLKNASADQFAEHGKALISINGGFFDHDFRPLGLRVNNKKLENPLKPISWWGVFYVKGNTPFITSQRQFDYDNNIDFAVQSGPRLLIKGKIPSLKVGTADRSALGITADGKVIIIVTNNSAMSTKELAHLMKAPPLSCVDAINLDGGSSSQLFAHVNSFQLNVHGFSNVSDAIIVKSKE